MAELQVRITAHNKTLDKQIITCSKEKEIIELESQKFPFASNIFDMCS
jgi:hypothetical protein